MKKILATIALPVFLLLVGTPQKSGAQEIVYGEKYYTCLKVGVNILVSAINPWAYPPYNPGVKPADPNEVRMKPYHIYQETNKPRKNSPKKAPVRKEI